LAELLRPWLAKHGRDERPLANMPDNAARMLQQDMAAARRRWLKESQTDAERAERERSDFLTYQDADGRIVDFHGATRHGYISAIVAGGCSVKTAQELARHSTPVLTIGRYSHARLHDLRGAVESLPSLQPHDENSGPNRLAEQATGTDGKPVDEIRGQMRGQYGRETPQEVAKDGASEPPRNADAACRKVLPINTLDDKRRKPAKVVRGGVEPPTLGFSVTEQTAKSSGNRPISRSAGADAGAVETKNAHADPDLQAIIDAWPSLPEAIRAGILAVAKAAGSITGEDR
jgi:hypothetical protein